LLSRWGSGSDRCPTPPRGHHRIHLVFCSSQDREKAHTHDGDVTMRRLGVEADYGPAHHLLPL
jgi:hypothetical protein